MKYCSLTDIDHEIAAFIDGRLDEAEQLRVMERLARERGMLAMLLQAGLGASRKHEELPSAEIERIKSIVKAPLLAGRLPILAAALAAVVLIIIVVLAALPSGKSKDSTAVGGTATAKDSPPSRGRQ